MNPLITRLAVTLGWAATLIAGGAAPAAVNTSGVWPQARWRVASPANQGLDAAALDEAEAYARGFGGGSGCVIRHGHLVKEWGDPDWRADIKSATKGAFGTTLLGLAVDRGLVALDDVAARHYPAMGLERPENAAAGWLATITIRELATMTAGFDDGRPPRLAYRPGTGGIYSNDTSNMLAELLTLRFGEDLREVMRREVMEPIGAAPEDWAWRANAYRAPRTGGLPSREFASGITITHRALARIGYLYLRGGRWRERQILSPAFIGEATTPTDLPAPWPYYGFYWGTNGRSSYEGIPSDTFWALGLGDSMLLACPSLDMVVVRLGLGSKRSQMSQAGEWEEDWGARVAALFRRVARAVRDPHPASTVIAGVRWAPAGEILRLAPGSDNWPNTWGDDGRLYAAYGDGHGFAPGQGRKLSLGLVRISGAPPAIRGENIRAPALEQTGDGPAGRKASGLLMAGGILYLWARNAGNAQLAWSSDRGASWEWADWRFTESFGCPTFLQFGADYAGARDEYVYVYSPDAATAYEPADRMVLARVGRDRVRERGAYEFFRGAAADGAPRWSRDIAERAGVFHQPGGCYRSGVCYSAGLQRYLWCQTVPGPGDDRVEGGFGIFEAPEPWGPWSTVYFTMEWDVGPGESSSLPTAWMSGDGRTCHLLFSGNDCFSVRRLEFAVPAVVGPD